jgi:hypothetical protein
VAHALLSIPGELFYVVQKEVKKIEAEVVAEVEKVAKKAVFKAKEEITNTSEDISEAIDVASSTKRRSNKE